jgi:hypothetical protein
MGKENEEVSKPLALNIPTNIEPAASGAYVLKELRKHGALISATTSAAITLVAAQGAEESKVLRGVELQLGADWLPIKLTFKWQKENKQTK